MVFTVEGHEVYLWQRHVPSEVLEEVARLFTWKNADDGGELLHNCPHAEYVRDLIGPLPDGPKIKGWTNTVTVGKPLPKGGPWHADRPYGGLWKLCLYLDEVPDGGTEFGRSDTFSPPTPKGSVVLFDIMLWHRSRPFNPKYTKRVIGLRAF